MNPIITNEDLRVRCASCGKPIKLKELGAITNKTGQIEMYHDDIFCLCKFVEEVEYEKEM
jgi:hypothetical protein